MPRANTGGGTRNTGSNTGASQQPTLNNRPGQQLTWSGIASLPNGNGWAGAGRSYTPGTGGPGTQWNLDPRLQNVRPGRFIDPAPDFRGQVNWGNLSRADMRRLAASRTQELMNVHGRPYNTADEVLSGITRLVGFDDQGFAGIPGIGLPISLMIGGEISRHTGRPFAPTGILSGLSIGLTGHTPMEHLSRLARRDRK